MFAFAETQTQGLKATLCGKGKYLPRQKSSLRHSQNQGRCIGLWSSGPLGAQDPQRGRHSLQDAQRRERGRRRSRGASGRRWRGGCVPQDLGCDSSRAMCLWACWLSLHQTPGPSSDRGCAAHGGGGGEVPIQCIKMSHGRGRHRQAGNRGHLSGKDRLDTGQSESPEQGQSWGFMGTTARGLLWVRAEVHHQEGTAGRAGAWVWQAGDCVSVEPGRGGPSTLVRVRMLMAVFGSGADHTLSTQTL